MINFIWWLSGFIMGFILGMLALIITIKKDEDNFRS